MSENPYTMNSLGPVWQQGYDAGQAALQSQLEPGPCGVKGHRRCDWCDEEEGYESNGPQGWVTTREQGCEACHREEGIRWDADHLSLNSSEIPNSSTALANAVRRARLEEAGWWDENALDGKGVWARKRLAELRRIP